MRRSISITQPIIAERCVTFFQIFSVIFNFIFLAFYIIKNYTRKKDKQNEVILYIYHSMGSPWKKCGCIYFLHDHNNHHHHNVSCMYESFPCDDIVILYLGFGIHKLYYFFMEMDLHSISILKQQKGALHLPKFFNAPKKPYSTSCFNRLYF